LANAFTLSLYDRISTKTVHLCSLFVNLLFFAVLYWCYLVMPQHGVGGGCAMLGGERRRKILARVATEQSIETQALADEFRVSLMTIRRDIKRLEQEGFLRQTYGGATMQLLKSVELGFNSRILQFSAQKRAIGLQGARLVGLTETIFLGEGTTTAQFAQVLPVHPRTLVITASLSHASLLRSRGIAVIVIGGALQADELATTGPIAEATVNRFYADTCVLGAAGVDADFGITELDLDVATLHRLMIERSRNVMLLADHSKFAAHGPAVVAPIVGITTLVTDQEASEDVLGRFRASKVSVVQAPGHPPDDGDHERRRPPI